MYQAVTTIRQKKLTFCLTRVLIVLIFMYNKKLKEMSVNRNLVTKAARLQIEINIDVELFGSTTIDKADRLEKLVDSFNSREEDLFSQLVNNFVRI